MSDKEKKSERVLLPISPSELKELNDWRRKQADPPGKAEAIRHMMREFLKAEKGKKR
jgi:hypothetical protein